MATAIEMDEVPTYISDEETSVNELVHSENKKRVKQRQRNWVKEMVFNNAHEAEQAIIEESSWGYSYTKCNTS
jgi:hypothetical protein